MVCAFLEAYERHSRLPGGVMRKFFRDKQGFHGELESRGGESLQMNQVWEKKRHGAGRGSESGRYLTVSQVACLASLSPSYFILQSSRETSSFQ